MTNTQFGIQFVVTRNGEPITDVITVENMPIQLHEKHNPRDVWLHQVKVLEILVGANLLAVDAFSGVVLDTRPVGLAPVQDAGFVKEKLGVPVLKVVNRALLALIKKLAARSTKRGTPMSIQFDDVEVTGEETDIQLTLRDVIEGYPERGPNDVD